MEPSPEELERRRQWFERYIEQLESNSVRSPEGAVGPFRCPCCGCLTLDERGGYDICPVCFWEDDGQDDHDADVVRGGPNGRLSLTEARANYRRFGACEERFIDKVRQPRAEEQGQGKPPAGTSDSRMPYTPLTPEEFTRACSAHSLVQLPAALATAPIPSDARGFLVQSGLPALIRYFGGSTYGKITFCRLTSGMSPLLSERTVGPPLPADWSVYWLLGDEFCCGL
jgi:hypothetical protein